MVRTATNSALVEALATSTQNGTPQNANRRVTRALTLETPPLPLSAPLTTLGAVTLANPGIISNTDEIPTGWTTECLGLARIDATTPNPTPDIAAQRALFDANWNRWSSTASRTDDASAVTTLAPIVTGTTCAAGTGEPSRSGIFTAACTTEWGARHITNSVPSTHPAVTLSGVSRYQGVLLVDSDLTITGPLDIDGLLVVQGALDTTAGTLNVFGAPSCEITRRTAPTSELQRASDTRDVRYDEPWPPLEHQSPSQRAAGWNASESGRTPRDDVQSAPPPPKQSHHRHNGAGFCSGARYLPRGESFRGRIIRFG